MKQIGFLTLKRMATRNLFRYRRRTIITCAALAFGLMFYILLDSLLKGAEVESVRNLLLYETASAKIMRDDQWAEYDSLPLNKPIEAPDRVLAVLRDQGINAAPRIRFEGELIVHQDPFPEDGSFFTQVYAIDPVLDDTVFGFSDTVSEGRYLQPGENGILLGGWLAEDLGAKVGYPLTIVTRTRGGYRQTIDVEVVGIIDCPNPLINRSGVFIPLDTADLYLQMDSAVTEIGITLANSRVLSPEQVTARLEPVKAAIGTVSPALDTISFHRLADEYFALAETKSSSSGIMLLFLFIIAAIGITNTMLISIYERTREIGMMRSLGMQRRHIRRMFLIEAAGIGAIGSLMGVVAGVLLNIPLINVGIDYSRWLREVDIGYRIQGAIRGTWELNTIIGAFVIGIVLSVAIAYFPVRRGLKKTIPECLRHGQ